jgi:PAP2 superfamily
VVADAIARLWLTGAGATGFAACYHGTAWINLRDAAVIGATAFDASLPCVPTFVWLYALGVVWPLMLAWTLPRAHWRQAGIGFAMISLVSALIWLAVPSDGSELRRQCIDVSNWALATLFQLDEPSRLFPSLHIGYAVFTALCLAAARPKWRIAAMMMVAAQIAAVCLVKQHYLVDVALGAIISVCAYYLSRTLSTVFSGWASASIHPSASR